MFEKIRTFPFSPTDEQIAFALKEITYARIDNWIDTDFATWGWILQLVMLIVSFAVWWKLVEKKRLLEITFYGFSIMTIIICLDEVGYELGIWYYPVDLIPVFPPSTAIDYVMLPVIYSLIYQYCATWRSFITAIFVLSGIFSFIMEPILVKSGFYVPIKWINLYSFPAYIILGIIIKLLVEQMKVVTARHKS